MCTSPCAALRRARGCRRRTGVFDLHCLYKLNNFWLVMVLWPLCSNLCSRPTLIKFYINHFILVLIALNIGKREKVQLFVFIYFTREVTWRNCTQNCAIPVLLVNNLHTYYDTVFKKKIFKNPNFNQKPTQWHRGDILIINLEFVLIIKFSIKLLCTFYWFYSDMFRECMKLSMDIRTVHNEDT